jgi:protein O-GlcNAc transferase
MSLTLDDAPVTDAAPAAREFSLAAAPSWRLQTADGLVVHVPNRLASISTYVLLEQERWFETEFGFVERLLDPDAWVLDIGANHGIYALALARSLPQGHVIAFEPTEEPRSRMLRSILDNGLADRIAVAPLGLSDSARDVTFNVSGESELNSMHGQGGRSERVRLDRLDAFLARHAVGQRIDFVKLDAEGEEPAVLAGGEQFFLAQSPIVMFELMHASTINHALPARFEALGYRIYRHLPALDVLAPWRADRAGPDVPLNLFAIKPARALALEARGLLAGDAESDADSDTAARSSAGVGDGRAWLLRQPCFASHPDEAIPGWPVDPALASALDAVLEIHRQRHRSATERLAAAGAVVDQLGASWTDAGQPPLARVALTIHALQLAGRHKAALAMAVQVLHHWPRDAVPEALFVPPTWTDLQRSRTTHLGEWLRLVIAEFVERERAFSTYFASADPLTLRRLLRHPDHSAEIERRYALGEFRQNRTPDRRLLPQLTSGRGSANPALWSAVLADDDAH